MPIKGPSIGGSGGGGSADLSVSGTKLKRLDTGAWEAAQTGVEYYAPDDFQHGAIYGTVIRQYFTTSLPAGLTSGNNVATLIDFSLLFGNGTTRLRARGWSSDGTNFATINHTGTSGDNNLALSLGGVFSGNMESGWVDYIKA